MRDLLAAGVHFGHQTNRWNPKMKPYIYGEYEKVYIFDLNKTMACMTQAINFVRDRVAAGDKVVFVGTKKQAQETIVNEAKRSQMYYVNHRWLGGTLTNFTTIRSSVDRLKSLCKMRDDGTFDKLTKKERLMLERDIQKLEKYLGGIQEMWKLPDILFVVDPLKERIAIKEARKMNIPVIAVTDTNCDPDGIDFVIPGNDDAIKSVRLFAKVIADACVEGDGVFKSRRAKDVASTDEVSQTEGEASKNGQDAEAGVALSSEGGDGPKVVIRGKNQEQHVERTD